MLSTTGRIPRHSPVATCQWESRCGAGTQADLTNTELAAAVNPWHSSRTSAMQSTLTAGFRPVPAVG